MNNIMIHTDGRIPDWRIGCSSCGATLREARQAPVKLSEDDFYETEPAAAPLPAPQVAPISRRETRVPPLRKTTDRRPHQWGRIRHGSGLALASLVACAFFAVLAGRPETASVERSTDKTIGAPHATDVGSQFGTEIAAVASKPREMAGLKDGLPDTEKRKKTIIPHYRIAAQELLGAQKEAYPDPLEGMIVLQLSALANPEQDAEMEAGLGLSRAKRREIQRRLKIANHDPKGIDGVFGPSTREAIADWQLRANLPPTGYVTDRTLRKMTTETAEEYNSWRRAEAARREREQRLAAAVPSPRPAPSTEECARAGSGEIAYGQNFRCDVRGLRDRLGGLGEVLVHTFSNRSRSQITMHRTAMDQGPR